MKLISRIAICSSLCLLFMSPLASALENKDNVVYATSHITSNYQDLCIHVANNKKINAHVLLNRNSAEMADLWVTAAQFTVNNYKENGTSEVSTLCFAIIDILEGRSGSSDLASRLLNNYELSLITLINGGVYLIENAKAMGKKLRGDPNSPLFDIQREDAKKILDYCKKHITNWDPCYSDLHNSAMLAQVYVMTNQ